MFRKPLAAGLTLCTLALVLAPKPAVAEVKPFKIFGAGSAPMGLPLPGEPGRPHWAVGDATDSADPTSARERSQRQHGGPFT